MRARVRERETSACGVALPGAPTGTAVAATTAGACTAIPKLWPGPTPIGTCSGGKNIRPHPPRLFLWVCVPNPLPRKQRVRAASPQHTQRRATSTRSSHLHGHHLAVDIDLDHIPRVRARWTLHHHLLLCNGVDRHHFGRAPLSCTAPSLVCTPQSVHALPDSRTILTSCDTCELVSCDSEWTLFSRVSFSVSV